MILTSLAGYKPKEKLVPVDEIQEGGEILIREIIGKRAEMFWSLKPENRTGINLLIVSMIDETGEPIHKIEDAEQIKSMVPDSVLSRLINAAFELSGFGSTSTTEGIHKAKKD